MILCGLTNISLDFSDTMKARGARYHTETVSQASKSSYGLFPDVVQEANMEDIFV